MTTIQQILNLKGDNIYTISPKATVFQALELMAKHDIGALPVVKRKQLIGIFSERDYARKVILKGKSSKDTLIEELMTSKVFFLKPDRSLDDCMALMSSKHIRHVPILNDGQLKGIITMRDVVDHLIRDQKDKIKDLEGYIAGSYLGKIPRIY